MIILHHAAAKKCSVEDIHQWHLNNGWIGIGYQYFVRKNGRVFRGRPEDVVGSHTSNFNAVSVGICFEGDFRYEKPTEAQIKSGQELVAHLKQKYQINKVKRHCELNNTSCPGQLFPFDKIANEKVRENLILSFQQAAVADKVKLPVCGVDGLYGLETRVAMEKCIVKKRYFYKYKNCTKLVQRLLGVNPIDGLCGKNTDAAIRKFQQENGLVADGAVGIKTWEKLLKIK